MLEHEIEHLFTYHAPNNDSIIRLQKVRDKAKEMATIINTYVIDCPDKTAAIRLLRQTVMTANAGIVLNQDT